MSTDGFKTCPFCSEEIRTAAVKCRYCGEWLESRGGEEEACEDSAEKVETAPLPAEVEAKKKSRLVTTLLNLLVPGAGYIYCRRWAPGIIAFSLVVGLVIAALTVEPSLLVIFEPPLALVVFMDSLLSTRQRNGVVFDETQASLNSTLRPMSSADQPSVESPSIAHWPRIDDETYKPEATRFFEEEKATGFDEGSLEGTASAGEPQHGQPSRVSATDDSTESPSSVPKEPGNYFARHWRGDLPLKVSYWVNCVLVSMLFGGFCVVLAEGMKPVDLRITAFVMITLNLLVVCVSIWQIVGTWRAAANSKSKGWPTIARVVMALWALSASSAVTTTLAPQTVEWCSILTGDTRIPPCVIRMLPGGTEMELSGGLRAGSAREFARALDFAPQVKVLHIESIGGRLKEAQQMARLVHERGLITYTSQQCLSAATVVFLAGKERVVAPGAKVGFHCGYFPGLTFEQRAQCDASEREAMRLAGVADWFATKALQTPPEGMWYPTFDELLKAHVVTTQSVGEQFTPSWDLSAVDAEDFEAKLNRMPAFAVIRELEPETYARLLEDVRAAIKAGKSPREAVALMGQMLGLVANRYVPAASGETLLALRDLQIRFLSQYKDRDSRACIAWLTGMPINNAQAFPGWDMDEVLRVMERIIRSGASRRPVVVDEQAATKDLTAISQSMAVKYGTDVTLLRDQARWMENSDKVCDMLLMMNRQIAALPDKRAANLARYLSTGEHQ